MTCALSGSKRDQSRTSIVIWEQAQAYGMERRLVVIGSVSMSCRGQGWGCAISVFRLVEGWEERHTELRLRSGSWHLTRLTAGVTAFLTAGLPEPSCLVFFIRIEYWDTISRFYVHAMLSVQYTKVAAFSCRVNEQRVQQAQTGQARAPTALLDPLSLQGTGLGSEDWDYT